MRGKAKTQFKRVLVSVLTAALVATGTFGMTTMQASASVADVSLTDPLKFSVYTNSYTNSNHVEGNVAVGALSAKMDIWEGKSFIGDLANSNAVFTCNVRDCIVSVPGTNSDGSVNVFTEQPGQGYKLTVMSGENIIREFVTDNKLIGYESRDGIKATIATVIEACKTTSAEFYALPATESDTLLVLHISAADFNGNGQYYDTLITESAAAGKTVVVNVADSGSVSLGYSMNANTLGGGLGYQSWAGNIVWNFGNASSVTVGGIFGTILAPSATVTNSSNIVGAIIANTFAQGGEVHQVNYTRGIPTPTPTPTPEETPTPTPEETPTPTPEETPTPTPEVTPTPTPEVTPTPTPEVTPTPTPEVTPTPTPEVTPTPTPEVTPTPTPEVTPTPTPE
ncbi:MAG: collagen-binding domain-containing protein, partial [Lachnospiraceae bacterium]